MRCSGTRSSIGCTAVELARLMNGQASCIAFERKQRVEKDVDVARWHQGRATALMRRSSTRAPSILKYAYQQVKQLTETQLQTSPHSPRIKCIDRPYDALPRTPL